LVVCLAVTLAAVACAFIALRSTRNGSGSTPVLVALVADPVASKTQPRATLTFSEDRRYKSGDPFSSKPTTTQVLRSFAPANVTLEQLLQSLRSTAVASYWNVDSDAPDAVRATKRMPFGVATLVIAINRYVSPAVVTVALAPENPGL
jgi:hypothetical protein